MFKNFTNKLGNIFSSKKINEESLLELEELLLISDIGIETVDKIINKLKIEKFSREFDLAEIKSKLAVIILDIIKPFQEKLPSAFHNFYRVQFCVNLIKKRFVVALLWCLKTYDSPVVRSDLHNEKLIAEDQNISVEGYYLPVDALFLD